MKAKEILELLEENGFEAYIVGGYVRDYLLGITSTDIDICTNAKVKDLLNILEDYNAYSDYYGNVKILSNKEQIDITTYRKDIKYIDNKPSEIEYVDNLLEDLKRRDFIMNTLCMNKNGEIIDLFNAKEDIEKKLIRSVGDARKKIEEDHSRILRAVRFACVLDFKIEESFYNILKENKMLISDLPKEKVKEELTKILINKNALKGLELMKRLGFLNVLGISYEKIVNVSDVCGMYSQLKFENPFPFSKEEKENIKNIQKILNYGKIDNEIIFDYGLYIASVAGSILGESIEDITSRSNNLPISNIKDIAITSDEICNILDISPNKVISEVYNELKKLVLNEKLLNDNSILCKFIRDNREKWLDEGDNKRGFSF